nr:MAG TPA: hypothetical protein [Caudoviricetes sp.]
MVQWTTRSQSSHPRDEKQVQRPSPCQGVPMKPSGNGSRPVPHWYRMLIWSCLA